MEKWSRREFLEVGALASIAMYSATTAELISTHEGRKTQHATSLGTLEEHDRDLLRITMDEIIPAGDAMPAASEVGGVDYVDKLAGRYKEEAKKLRESLGALEGLSKERFETSFLSLSHEQRIELLTALEKEENDAFKTLCEYTYEAYYTQPAVWKLIGYEFYPTNMSGPHMKPFDEAMLAEVRKKPKHYREA